MKHCPHQNAFKHKIIMTFLITGMTMASALGQTQLEPWGNIIGIRVDGQPMQFESSLRVVNGDWSVIRSTGQERQHPKYHRDGNKQVVETRVDSTSFIETVEDIGKGNVKVTLEVSGTPNPETVCFSLSLPDADYSAGLVTVDGQTPMPLMAADNLHPAGGNIRSVRFTSPTRQLELTFDEPGSMVIRHEEANGSAHAQVYFPMTTSNVQEKVSRTFMIRASGHIDKKPVTLTLDTTQTGRVFEGLGGNFRLQNPKADPQVIDYCLQNLRVAWGRVEMPWAFWQPALEKDPMTEAKEGRLNARVRQAMEMAQRLYKMGIPVILTAWSAPAWAVVGTPKFRPGPDGVWGNPLDHSKDNAIYKSIADYIAYLRDNYGVEISLFSFNESDLGINIRQTGEEHVALIKGLGAYLASRGLKTRMLLGDNSDATTYSFIYPAMNDPETYPYIGAISFHSWRGWDKEILEKWADAATKMKLPLLVGEGSIDAAAWNYPAIFREPVYAMQEINLYTRLLAICEPESILQWQLTSDYSPLAGGGIFGNNEPLHPTQRFWNLKQLSSTPKGLKAMAIGGDHTLISCAALGDPEKGVYAIHLVNNGAKRQVTLEGLPKGLKQFRMYITDSDRGMKEMKPVKVKGGVARFTLDTYAYTTLISF